MRIIVRILAVFLILVGCVWFLQGVNILPGSFMTGQIRWVGSGGIHVKVGIVYGVIAVVVGVVLLVAAAKRRTLKG